MTAFLFLRMPDILKTIEGWRDTRRVLEYLREGPNSPRFLFNVGRARPKQPIERLWFCFHGRVVGHFAGVAIGEATSQLAYEYAHQYDPPYWHAARFLFLCPRPFHFMKERVHHRGFRGWRYFDLDKYGASPEHQAAVEDANMERILSQ